MRQYLTENDLVVGYIDGNGGDHTGVQSELKAEPGDLRFDGEDIIDPKKLNRFAIDPSGRKRLPEMNTDEEWPELDCQFGDELRKDGDGWRVKTQADVEADAIEKRIKLIKAECSRRIYGVASREAQMNVATAAALASLKTASARSNEEKAVIAGAAAGVDWVQQMMAAVQTLAANIDADFEDDPAWPDCPPEAASVYGQF